jgi:predicted PurR-regulated permease PerM
MARKIPPDNGFELLFQRTLFGMTTLLVVLGFLYLISLFFNIVTLLGLSVVMAYVLVGPVGLLEKGIVRLGKGLGNLPVLSQANDVTRGLSVIVVYIAFFSLLTFAGVRLLPILSVQVHEFGKALPRYFAQVEVMLIDWTDRTLGAGTLKSFFKEDIEQATKAGSVSGPVTEITEAEKEVIHQSMTRNAVDQVSTLAEQAITSALGNLTNGFIYTVAGLLLVFYLLMDGHRLRDVLIRRIPPTAGKTVNYFLCSFHEVMFAFIKGQFMLGILTGTYMFVIYSIFDVKYAFFLGAFFAVSEILPVVGTWIGFTPGIIVILFSEDPMLVLPVWLCSYIFQTFKDNVLAPKIVGDVMGLHPVVVIFAIVICAKAAGLIGILIALPLASILNIALDYLVNGPKFDPEDARQPLSVNSAS